MITEYDGYNSFINDLAMAVVDEGYASVICDCKDYSRLIKTIQEHTFNGKSVTLSPECVDNFDADIQEAMQRKGNMMITVYDDATMIGEPIIYETTNAFVDGTYFVEVNAVDAMRLPLSGDIIPFCIRRGAEV